MVSSWIRQNRRNSRQILSLFALKLNIRTVFWRKFSFQRQIYYGIVTVFAHGCYDNDQKMFISKIC